MKTRKKIQVAVVPDLDTLPAQALLTSAEVIQVVRVSRMQINRWCREGHFPRPIKLGPPPPFDERNPDKLDTRRSFWRVADLREWLDARAGSGGPEAA